jgi:hypothetical protein
MNNNMLNGMALAFFSTAYADQADEAGQPLRGEITAQLPSETDPAALQAARTLYADFERALIHCTRGAIDGLDGAYVHIHGVDKMKRDTLAEQEVSFGFFTAMQAMGTGVGIWEDCTTRISGHVPHVEFGSYSLERDYF